MPDAIVGTDAGWRINAWNPAAERIFGLPAAAAIGRRILELADVDTPFAEGRLSSVREVLESRGRWSGRTTYRMRESGRIVVGDVQVARLAGPDGAWGGAVAVVRDVTASARLEAAFGGLAGISDPAARKSTEVTAIALAALDTLARTTACTHAAIVAAEPDGSLRVVAQVGLPAEVEARLREGWPSGILPELPGRGDPILMGPIELLGGTHEDDTLLRRLGIAEFALVSLSGPGDPPMRLWLGWPAGTTPPAPLTVGHAGSIIAAAIDHARRIAAIRGDHWRAERLVGRLDALFDLAAVRADASSPAARDERIVRRTAELIGADAGVLADVAGAALVIRAAFGLAPELVRILEATPVHLFGETDLASGTAQPERLTAAPADADQASVEAFRGAGFRVTVAIPVNLNGRLERLAIFLARDPAAADVRAPELRPIAHVLRVAIANGILSDRLVGSEARYRELFESAPDPIFVQALDGRIVDANRSAEAVFRRTRAELIGRPIGELAVADPGTDALTGLQAAPADAGPQRYLGIRADGSRFPVEAHAAMVDLGGEARIMLTVRDLTDRERIQFQLLQAQKMETIAALVGGVRHELNNPLTAVRGYADLISTDWTLPETTREDARRIREAGDKAISLVSTFADFARERPSTWEAFELREAVEGILTLMRFDFIQPLRPRSSAGVAVDVDLPAGLPRVIADRGRIEQVLLTLLQNSLDAFRAKAADRPDPIGVVGRIQIAAEVEGERIRCRVSDDGPGIPDGLRSRLFLPFTSSKAASRGLGLWVAARLAAASNGSLSFDPSARVGATFVLDLPIVAPDLAAAQVYDVAPATRRRPSAAGESERPWVLVVDDERLIRDLVPRLLDPGDWQLAIADDGVDALMQARSHPFDLVLMDYRMPGLSGVEVYRDLVAGDPSYRGRVALMSGNEWEPELEALRDDEGVEILEKTEAVRAESLAAHLARLLEKAGRRA